MLSRLWGKSSGLQRLSVFSQSLSLSLSSVWQTHQSWAEKYPPPLFSLLPCFCSLPAMIYSLLSVSALVHTFPSAPSTLLHSPSFNAKIAYALMHAHTQPNTPISPCIYMHTLIARKLNIHSLHPGVYSAYSCSDSLQASLTDIASWLQFATWLTEVDVKLCDRWHSHTWLTVTAKHRQIQIRRVIYFRMKAMGFLSYLLTAMSAWMHVKDEEMCCAAFVLQ